MNQNRVSRFGVTDSQIIVWRRGKIVGLRPDRLRLFSWNCNGGLGSKLPLVWQTYPDLAVILEADESSVLAKGGLWQSVSGKKGIGLFSSHALDVSPHPDLDPNIVGIYPFVVTGKWQGILFCVWTTKGNGDTKSNYIAQVYRGLQHYQRLFESSSCLMAGDFNSNASWDHKRPLANHSQVVERLLSHSIFSIYHHKYQESHGDESQPTFFQYRNREKGHHIDYVFASSSMVDSLASVSVGDTDFWLEHSDHLPLLASFCLPE